MNRVLWGSALVSGYGSLSALYSVANVWPNLLLYPGVDRDIDAAGAAGSDRCDHAADGDDVTSMAAPAAID